MLPPVVGAVMRGIVFDDLDIADETCARVGAFDQIVTQQGIAREAALENLVYGCDFVNSLACKCAFAI